MATLSDSSYSSGQRRKKPVTYGKASRNTTFTAQGVGAFFDNSEDKDSTALRPKRLPTITRTLPKRPVPRKEPVRDEFDVPVSDDETPQKPSKPTQVKPAPTGHSSLRPRREATTPNKLQKEQKRKSPNDGSPAQKRTRTASPVSPSVLDVQLSGPPCPVMKPPSPEQGNVRRSRRNVSKSTTIRPSPPKGISAPARLHQMVSDAVSQDQIHVPDPSNANNYTESQDISSVDELPGTPRRPAMLRSASSITPKQSQLWSQLLSSDPVDPQSEVSDERLSRTAKPQVSHRRTYAKPSSSKRSTSDMVNGELPRQARLVDHLKQTAQPHDESDESDGETIFEYPAERLDRNVETTRTETKPLRSQKFTLDNTQKSSVHESQSQQLDSQSSNSQNTAGSKMTYARMRSYLQEDNFEDNLMSALPTEEPIKATTAARRVGGGPLKKGKTKSNSMFDFDDESDDGATTGIRSIHELRAAGNKKRFVDDNAALFEDIKDHKASSKSRRRSALIELATKLLEKSFLTRFVEHSFDDELSAEFSVPYSDTVSDAAICAVLAQISDREDGDESLADLYRAGALDVAVRCLNEKRPVSQIAKDRRSNMSKVAQSNFLEFSETIRISNLWGDQKPEMLTLQLLGLKCMELMVLRLRRQGNKSSMLSPNIIAKLVSLVTLDDDQIKDASPTSPQAITRRLALSILEFASTSKEMVTTWSTEQWEQIVSVLPAMVQLRGQSQALVLRLCINLTNGNADNCETCSQGKVVKVIIHQIAEGFDRLHDGADEEEQKARLDSLILLLGLMINLAEFSDAACEEAANVEVNGLASLASTFIRGQERIEDAQSEEETQSNVAYGFLAVMLGNLCQNYRAREQVRVCLPGNKLQTLLAAIAEFAHYNHTVDSQTHQNDEGKDVWAQFTGRLMAVVERLQEFEG